jgi:hypothetical protein
MELPDMESEDALEQDRGLIDDGFDEEVLRACRIASSGDEIGAVHVYIGRRPTYDEIIHCRALASRNGLELTVYGDGRVRFRRNKLKSVPQPPPASDSSNVSTWVNAVEHYAKSGIA